MTRRITQLLIGLFLYGIGIALIVRAEIGVAPWDVLTQGIDNHTGLGFGLITIVVSGIVLLFWIPIRQRPGIGTVLNAFLVGPSADVGLWLIPEGLDLWLRIILFAAGLLTLAIATGLYIGAHFGPGPRDGLMTGLHKTTGQKIWVVRTAIEVVVLAIGWALGGNVGIGTVLFAVLVGPLCNWTMPLFAIKRPSAVLEPVDARGFDPSTSSGRRKLNKREAKLEGSAAPSTPIIDSPAN